MKRFLSGIQPSGLPHLGNWFGAVQMHLERAKLGNAFFFIADYHALTTLQDPKKLREYVREIAATYLAAGLGETEAVFWRQSEVPEVTEIAWLLATVTGLGLLERGHSYKDKVAKGLPASAGLLYYPVLMAADILAYDADIVPVGKDQVQHIEMTQDMAGSWNAAYGETFRRPEWELSKSPKVSGLDGQKMSKSYGNALWIFEEGKALKKAIGSISTDSRSPEEPKDPKALLLFEWLELLLPADEVADLARRVREGGAGAPGYGQLKGRLVAAMEDYFASSRKRRLEYLAHPAHIEEALAKGAKRAREVARAVRDRALIAAGLR